MKCGNCKKEIECLDNGCYSKHQSVYFCSLDCLTDWAHEFLECIPLDYHEDKQLSESKGEWEMKVKELIKELKKIRRRITEIYMEIGNPEEVKADMILKEDINFLESKKPSKSKEGGKSE